MAVGIIGDVLEVVAVGEQLAGRGLVALDGLEGVVDALDRVGALTYHDAATAISAVECPSLKLPMPPVLLERRTARGSPRRASSRARCCIPGGVSFSVVGRTAVVPLRYRPRPEDAGIARHRACRRAFTRFSSLQLLGGLEGVAAYLGGGGAGRRPTGPASLTRRGADRVGVSGRCRSRYPSARARRRSPSGRRR